MGAEVNIGTLKAYLGADTRQLTAGLHSGSSQITRFANTSNKAFAGMAKSIGMVTGALAALGLAVGAGAIFRGVVSSGAQFQQTMTTAGAVMRATEEEMTALTAVAREMGEKTEWTATQAAESLKFLGMAGFEAGKAIKALPGTLDLATAGGIDLGRAADIATNALTAMGLPVEQLTRVNDVFVGTITRSNTNMEMLAESFKYAAPVAHAYGYSIEELSGIIGMLGNAGVQGCYDDKTDVLTRRGWIPWAESNESDEFATRNPETGGIEYQKADRLVRYRHSGPMYYVQNRSLDLCVTPDHRMWVKRRGHDSYEIVTAEAVDGKSVSYESGGLNWQGVDFNEYALPGFEQNRASWIKSVPEARIDSELWARFLGWYLSEGCCDYTNGTYRVTISQRPGELKTKMLEELGRMPWPCHYSSGRGIVFSCEQLYREVAYLGKSYEKHIPQYAKEWAPRLLRVLLESMIEGDGDVNGAYYTSSKKLADDVQEIALKCGSAASVVLKNPAGTLSNYDKEDREIRAKHDQWKVNIRNTMLQPQFYPYEYRGVHGERHDGSIAPCRSGWMLYDGEVFCAEVPNHLLIVRRNGKAVVSGNSMAGTQLAQAFIEARDIAREFGFESSDLIDVLESLKKKFGDNVDMMEFFTKRSGRAALILREATGATRDFQETLLGVGGEAETLANKMRSTLGGAFKELKSVIESIGLDAFDVFGDKLKKFVKDTTAFLRENRDSFVTFTKDVTSAAETLGRVAGGLWDVISAFPVAVLEYFQHVREESEKTREALLSDSAILQAGFQPPPLTPMQEFLGEVAIGFKNLKNDVVSVFKAMGNAAAAMVLSVLDLFGNLFTGLDAIVQFFATSIEDAFESGDPLMWLFKGDHSRQKYWNEQVAETFKKIWADATGQGDSYYAAIEKVHDEYVAHIEKRSAAQVYADQWKEKITEVRRALMESVPPITPGTQTARGALTPTLTEYMGGTIPEAMRGYVEPYNPATFRPPKSTTGYEKSVPAPPFDAEAHEAKLKKLAEAARKQHEQYINGLEASRDAYQELFKAGSFTYAELGNAATAYHEILIRLLDEEIAKMAEVPDADGDLLRKIFDKKKKDIDRLAGYYESGGEFMGPTIAELGKETKKTGKKMRTWADDLAKDMAYSFEEKFFKILKGEFNGLADLVENLGDAIRRIIAQALSSKLQVILSGAFQGSGGGGGFTMPGGYTQFRVPAPDFLDTPIDAFDMAPASGAGKMSGGNSVVINLNGVTDFQSFRRNEKQLTAKAAAIAERMNRRYG